MAREIQVVTPAAKEGTIETPIRRTQCPFHQFMGFPGLLADASPGNACALTFEHSPCAVEMRNETPCWDACWRYNTEANRPQVDQLLGKFNAFPKELSPYGDQGWTGINARAWFRLITGHDLPDKPPVKSNSA